RRYMLDDAMDSPTPILVGIPYDATSSYLRGPAEAPAAVRRVLHSGSGNWWTELGVSVDPTEGHFVDAGDLKIPEDPHEAFVAIRDQMKGLADRGPLLAVGGDHFVTYPVLAACAETYEDITLLHVDAHPDLYDELNGQRLSHATPFTRIMEEGYASRLIQFGIRTATRDQREQAARFGVEMHSAADWDGTVPEVSGNIYLTIDVDGLDPAFAPGVSHHEPGGLTTRQVLGLIHQLIGRSGIRLIGADVVEINPRRDHHDMTAALGAKLIKELVPVAGRPAG
ncbi:MAG: agmatinase, partial [Myxococcota bacterium]